MDRVFSTLRRDEKHKVLVEKPEGKNHLGKLGVEGRTMLKSILKKQ
jgi:hypothetical protein